MHFLDEVGFEDVTAGVQFCQELTRPNIAVIR
jgi:hypothetical protein